MKSKYLISFFLILLIIIPFSFLNKGDKKAVVLDDSSFGYYQTNTCEITLGDFLFKNISNNLEIYYNNHNYGDINCFGTITGIDKTADKYTVSIGTNSSINLILQSVIWVFIFSLLPRHKYKKGKKNNSKLILPLIFMLPFISEYRFYSSENIIYNNEISLTNYYLIGNFIFITLSIFVLDDVFSSRYKNIINYIPYIFFISGTFSGLNLNIYIFVFSFFGLNYIFKYKSFNIFDILYFLFSIFWFLNIEENNFFFDGDKLRGFINSTYSIGSQLFWILVLYLSVKGLIYLTKTSLETFNLKLFIQNSLKSGSLVLIFGIIGSTFPIMNFFNFYIFGQNKRGMKNFDSIAGNTWRGFSPSAESIGEFYAFTILIFFLYLLKTRSFNSKIIYIYIFPVIYGLYRSNNFASLLSLSVLLLIVIIQKFQIYKENKIRFWLLFIVLLISGFGFYGQINDYQYLSTELLYEATLHQDFYSNENSYTSYLEVEKKMIERDLNSILIDEDNFKNSSSTYQKLLSLFTVNFNIPLLPNLVAIISMISLMINRTEMWGIFIAKHNPNILESLFGYGPLQINKYLYSHNVKLDVPEAKIQEFYLPHSSYLDLILFSGFIGLAFIICFLGYLFYKNLNTGQFFLVPLIFYLINLTKSDSILYVQSFYLLILLISLNYYQKEIKYNE
tara:strand:+ start:771 stop:2795 length:2025 start_codon:yes stop_codon:yes gene_type:complete